MSDVTTWALAAAALVAALPALLRWLRIAQREHYIPASVTRFAWRWWTSSPMNVAILLGAVAGTAGALRDAIWGFAVVAAQAGPMGLTVMGRTSPVYWTARLKRVAALAGVLIVAGLVSGVAMAMPLLIAMTLLGAPAIVDASLFALRPIEKRLGTRWVDKASAKLRAVGPEVVAITGSYGKTTTKGYVAHLVGGSRRTVASPASFNNRMGLARAINEHLVPGTEVFIAEMGTYGPGEIAELCSWIPPKVAAMVSIGPVHLERFKTEERIVEAKSEILDGAGLGVICVDHPLLYRLADERAKSMPIRRVSAANGAVTVDGDAIADVPDGVFGANLAVAFGIGMALGVDVEEMKKRIPDLPRPEHRLSTTVSDLGVTIIDDTFNSNPAGARRGLEALRRFGAEGRRVVVTPGMVELGPLQESENESWARDAAGVANDIVIVGRTNRRALLRGAETGDASVTVVESRIEAVDWVRGNLVAGDAVLYENDLPDHYP
ncbi:MAG: Mur ligase family protein [Acidimicrobiia bacterium]|nr:Mur ligase family protein [Acidimicrobiia bacterium]